MLFFGTRFCITKVIMALVLVDIAIAAAVKTSEIIDNIPKGKGIKFGFYKESTKE